jgi:hypothetical protein
MPTVPTEFVQSVLPEGHETYLHVKATPREFGSRMARTLDLAGNRLERGAVARQLLNETNVNDVYANQFDPAFRDMYANFLKLGGKDAGEQFPAVQQQMMDLAAQTSAGLPNDIQRSLFDEISRRRMNSDFEGMARHTAASMSQWQTETARAMSDALGKRIGDNIYDFDKVAGPDGLINGIRRMNEAESALAGEDSSVSGLRAAGSIDKGLSDAILNEARSNPEGAKLLYDRYQQFLSSDAVREHVLGNLSPILSDARKTAAYNDAVARFGALGAPAGIDATGGGGTAGLGGRSSGEIDSSPAAAATAHVMNPENYPDLDPDQRSEVARAVRAEWNRQSQARDDSQKAANDNLQVGAISGAIAPEQLLTWRDPKTGFAASPQTVHDVGEWLANPVRATHSNPDALAGLAEDIAGRRLTDAAPINEAFRSGNISRADWMHMRDLLETASNPAKSLWFDYAREAFYARAAGLPASVDAAKGAAASGGGGAAPDPDPATPNAPTAETSSPGPADLDARNAPPQTPPEAAATLAGGPSAAMKLFPPFLMDLDGAVRSQDLKPTQIRDLTNRMLDDVGNLLPAVAWNPGPPAGIAATGDAAPAPAPDSPEAGRIKNPPP